MGKQSVTKRPRASGLGAFWQSLGEEYVRYRTQIIQGSLLLEHGAGERSQRLMKAMDALNSRYGRNTVSVFTPSSPKPWAMRRKAMSPCYTTRWSDLPVAHAR